MTSLGATNRYSTEKVQQKLTEVLLYIMDSSTLMSHTGHQVATNRYQNLGDIPNLAFLICRSLNRPIVPAAEVACDMKTAGFKISGTGGKRVPGQTFDCSTEQSDVSWLKKICTLLRNNFHRANTLNDQDQRDDADCGEHRQTVFRGRDLLFVE